MDRNVTLHPGDPLSPVKMAEIQKRLYDLGVFAKVDMAVQNQDGETERKYVIYDVQEARRYSVTAGIGAQLANIGGSNAADSLADPGRCATGIQPARFARRHAAQFYGPRPYGSLQYALFQPG